MVSPFELELERQDAERRARADAARATVAPMPAGFQAEDFLGPSSHGYVPLREAARRMRLDEAEVVRLVDVGALEATGDGYVRPAIVSVAAFQDAGTVSRRCAISTSDCRQSP